MSVTVRIANSYACGRVSTSEHEVRGPAEGESVDQWWEVVVFPLTGDGHPCGADEYADYEATVVGVDTPMQGLLAGRVHSWAG
jgi:hypothetical protein